MKYFSLKIRVFTLSLFLLFSLSLVQGTADRTRPLVSKYFDAFFDHVEKIYLKNNSQDWNDFIYFSERAKLLGFALGRQAANVKDIKVRREIFERLEADLQRYLVMTGTFLINDLGTGTIASKRAWEIAMGAMMGFYDEEIIKKTGIDPDRIPNIFESSAPGLDLSGRGEVPGLITLVAQGHTSFRKDAAMRIALKVSQYLSGLGLHPLPGKFAFEFRSEGNTALGQLIYGSKNPVLARRIPRLKSEFIKGTTNTHIVDAGMFELKSPVQAVNILISPGWSPEGNEREWKTMPSYKMHWEKELSDSYNILKSRGPFRMNRGFEALEYRGLKYKVTLASKAIEIQGIKGRIIAATERGMRAMPTKRLGISRIGNSFPVNRTTYIRAFLIVEAEGRHLMGIKVEAGSLSQPPVWVPTISEDTFTELLRILVKETLLELKNQGN